ncbi:DUF2993 domain-containing protein [Flexivirga meconopsidis]|uniref:LmeA family phospholipid-binding protein n=1 Tax=Flexivirga meconopsidis TaxID=2977121 RepID=UPI0022402C1D|nr:DUF2993 domain-containing protein [Flexivirga meconopsidis]
MTEQPRRRRRAPLIAAVAILAVLALVAGAEFLVRHQLRSSVSNAMENGLRTSSVDVGIGSTPALLDLGRGSIDKVTLNAQNATICQVRDVSINADVRDVSTSPSGGRIGESNLALTLSGQAMADLVAGSGQAQGVTATPEPASGTVQLSGFGGLAQIWVRPSVKGGQLDFTITKASLAGRDVPADQAQKMLGGSSGGSGMTQLPLGLKATSVKVTGAGLVASFRGAPTTLPKDKQPLDCKSTGA